MQQASGGWQFQQLRLPTMLQGHMPTILCLARRVRVAEHTLSSISPIKTSVASHEHLSSAYQLAVLLQAPKVLAELCIRALQLHPQSTTQLLVIQSLSLLLEHCSCQQGCDELGSRVTAAVLQQLHQAGLLLHMPALLTLAAQELTAATSPAQGSAGLGSNSSSSSSSSSNTSRDPSNRSHGCFSFFAWDATRRVLFIYSSLLFLMSCAGDNVAALQPAPAALQLMLTAYEALQQQQQQQPYECNAMPTHLVTAHTATRIHGLWVATAQDLFWQIVFAIGASLCNRAGQAAGRGQSESAPAASAAATADSKLDELLCSPQLYRCLTLLTCVSVMSLPGNSSSGSSGSSGSSNSSRAGQGRVLQGPQSPGASIPRSAPVAAGCLSFLVSTW
jgi:hypothetical protein